MKTNLKTIAIAAVLLGAGAPAFAQSQLTANAGLTPAEAAGLSLTEIAAAKFSRNAGSDEQVPVVVRGTPSGNYDQLAASAGLSPEEAEGMSLKEIFVAKINAESGGDDQQIVKSDGPTAMSRSVGNGASHPQLVAGAGLSADEAAGLSLSEIAAAKFARDTGDD